MREAKKTRGRKTSHQPGMCERLIELGKEGCSLTEMAVGIGITKETLYQWSDPDGEYFKQDISDALKVAKAESQAWWERKGRSATFGEDGKTFAQTAFIFQMKNRFREDYSESAGVDDPAPSMAVSINVTQPVGDVRITKPDA